MQVMVVQSKNEQFSQRLNKLLNDMDVPPMNLGRAKWFHDFVKKQLKIDVSYEATRKWLSGESIPYTKRIGLIAYGLNSTTEYLIGEAPRESQTLGVKEKRAKYSMEEISLLEKINKLSPADKARLSSIVDALNQKPGKKTGN